MSCDQVEYRPEQQQRVVQMEKYDVDEEQMNTTPKVFLLDDLILILYSFLTNKECMAFHLVNKNIKYNLRILPKRESYGNVIAWKKYINPIRTLSNMARYFPYSKKLVFTNFSTEDITFETSISIASLYPDVRELVLGNCKVPYVTNSHEDVNTYSPTRNNRRRNNNSNAENDEFQYNAELNTLHESQIITSFAKRMKHLQVLTLMNIGGDITGALNVLISSCVQLTNLKLGNDALRCECGWEMLTKGFCAFRFLKTFEFSGHIFHHQARDTPLEFDLNDDVTNIKSFSVGGRLTSRMIRDAAMIFRNLNHLKLGRVSDMTMRALLDVYDGFDISLISLSLTARLSPSLSLPMIVNFLRSCKKLRSFAGHKFHAVNHHLINILTSLKDTDENRGNGLEELCLTDYSNWNSGQPTDLTKRRMLSSFLNLHTFAFMNLSDELLSHMAENCHLIKKLIIQNSPRVTDKSIKSIKYLSRINHLELSKTKMTCNGETELLENIGTKLKILQIKNYEEEEKFNDYDLIQILNYCTNAIEIDVKSILLSNKCSEMIGKMAYTIQKTLQVLKLGECSIECLQRLKEALPAVLVHAVVLD